MLKTLNGRVFVFDEIWRRKKINCIKKQAENCTEGSSTVHCQQTTVKFEALLGWASGMWEMLLDLYQTCQLS